MYFTVFGTRQIRNAWTGNQEVIQNGLENLGQIRVHSSWEFATAPKLTARGSEFQTSTVETDLDR
jgi:hypothetical protein